MYFKVSTSILIWSWRVGKILVGEFEEFDFFIVVVCDLNIYKLLIIRILMNFCYLDSMNVFVF